MRPRPDHPLRPVATSPITRLAVLIAVAGLASVAVGGGEAPALAQDSANGTAASSSLLGAISPSSSGFGATGQWVFSLSDPAEFPFLLLKNGSNPWHVLVQPSADTFLFPEVSVGGLVKFERNGGTTDVGVGARVGYDLHFTGLVSLWLRGGLFYHPLSVNNGPSRSETFLDLQAPALFHLVPHFFLGAGPTISLPLQGQADTTFGLEAIVGGYL